MMFNSFSLWKDQSRACYHCSRMDELLSQLIRTNLNRPHKSMTLPSPGTWGFFFLTCRVKRNGFWTCQRGVFFSGSLGNLCANLELSGGERNPISKSLCLDEWGSWLCQKHSLQDVGRKRLSVTPFLTFRNKNMDDFRVSGEFWRCREAK